MFEIALRNESAKLDRVSVDRFSLKESNTDANGFTCVYENESLEVAVKAEIKDEIRWGINIINKGEDVIEELSGLQKEVVDNCDVIVDGPYKEELRDIAHCPFRGSTNQHFYKVTIAEDGKLVFTEQYKLN